MFVPGISTPRKKSVFRRKGGGGGGKGGGGGGTGTGSGKGSGSTGRSGSSSSGSKSSVPLSGGSNASGKSSASAYGSGGGKSITIPSGQLFSGRTAGGGTRSEVPGTRTYGSGYPGISGRGVAGRGFPFFFWPVAWGGPIGYGPLYLHDSEYGRPDNSSRPGGPMYEATFSSNSTSTTFHVLADNSTVISLVDSINANCSSSISSSNSSSTSSNLPIPYNASAENSPKPEQAVQYYRASSVVLTLDGYNDTATLSDDENSTDTALPSGIDTTLLGCLNDTIAAAVPLIDAASSSGVALPSTTASFGVGTVWLSWLLLHYLL